MRAHVTVEGSLNILTKKITQHYYICCCFFEVQKKQFITSQSPWKSHCAWSIEGKPTA